MAKPLLEVVDLRTHFFSDEGVVRAVDGVSLSISEGETLGLVGESACGKSATALSILRLIDRRQGAVVGGRVRWRGRDLLTLSEREMRLVRGNEIGMVFQDSFASLNPVFTIGNQLSESVRIHQGAGRREALSKSREALARVRIPSPEMRLHEYPHQMSGGMQQRVMIAMSLLCNPRLLIADEPTTALDVTIQAQILDLLEEIQRSSGMALLLISHDLGVISELADRIAIMYAGKIVEEGPARQLLASPAHPYTRALLRSVPLLGGARRARLEAIRGSVPNPTEYPLGCRFHPRCGMAQRVCVEREPELSQCTPGYRTACHFTERIPPGVRGV
jgi:oligopeptide/dipeptide ABC transporter ATP-binding protein